MVCNLLFLLSGMAPAALAGSIEADQHAAVILAYYRIGEDDYGDSNLPTEQFLAHIKEIKESGYKVISLPKMIEAFKTGQALPDHTLVITFQGAYKSALENAIPVLLKEKIPFTVFYSGAQADSREADVMNWRDLQALSRYEQVTLGVLTDSYDRLAQAPDGEIKRQVNNAVLKHRQYFSVQPQFFAYPYGEYLKNFQSIVKAAGFSAALGLQSGAAYAGDDLYALPRFTMSAPYGDVERFQLVADALPFPVTDQQPAGSFLTEKTLIGFSVPAEMQKDLDDLSCFISGEAKPDVEIIGTRVELRRKDIRDDERVRINCTLPSGLKSEDGPRWRWFGMLLAPSQG